MEFKGVSGDYGLWKLTNAVYPTKKSQKAKQPKKPRHRPPKPYGTMNNCREREDLSANEIRYIKEHTILGDKQYGLDKMGEKFRVRNDVIYEIICEDGKPRSKGKATKIHEVYGKMTREARQEYVRKRREEYFKRKLDRETNI